MGLEDMVAKPTQSESKGWTLLNKLVCEKAIGSVQSASAVVMSRCVVVAVAVAVGQLLSSESTLVRTSSTTIYIRAGYVSDKSVCRRTILGFRVIQIILSPIWHNDRVTSQWHKR